MKRAHIANLVFNRPLLLSAEKANVIAPFLVREILGEPGLEIRLADTAEIEVPARHAGVLGKSANLPAYASDDQLVPRTGNGVGVVSIEGTLIHKGAWIGVNSGETSYQGITRQFAEAMDDDSIRAVVVEVDSHGGEVSGCADAATMLAELSAMKPTLAILTDHAFSAAYWIASQAREIVLPRAGGCGSIGVIAMHVDYSDYLKQEGLAVTLVHAGARKADGNAFEALPPSVREEWEAEFEILRNQFAEAVAAGRGDRFNAKAALDSEARTFMGEEAVRAGLADAVGSPREAFQSFVDMF
jgi:signal peptide peptidase SppA